MASDETAVALLDRVQYALSTAVTLEDFREIRDMAQAARAYAKARGLGLDAENKAAEYVIRAERGMGVVLQTLKEEGRVGPGLNMKGAPRVGKGEKRPVNEVAAGEFIALSDLGITHQESSLFQLLARIPEEEFNARFERVKAAGSRLAKVDFYRLVKPTIKQAKDAQKAIREEEHADDATPVFAKWAEATEALLDHGIAQLPNDELSATGEWLRQLLTAYNAEHGRRTL